MLSGIEMAIQEINEINPPGHVLGSPVELVGAGETGDTNVAMTQAQRQVGLHMQALIGPAITSLTLAVMDDVARASVVQCSPSAWQNPLTDYPDGGYLFRTTTPPTIQAPVIAQLIAEAGFKTVAIAALDDEYGRQLSDEAVKQLAARGARVIARELYDPEAFDANQISSAILAAGADAHIIISFSEGSEIVQGLLDGGVQAKTLFAADGMSRPEFGELFASTTLLNGMTVFAPSEEVPEMFDAQIRAFNPNIIGASFAPNAYDCANLIALAATTAGSTLSKDIRDNMFAVTQGANSCYSFAECKEFLDRGDTIAYISAHGLPIDFMRVREGGGDPFYGTVTVRTWQAGELVTIHEADTCYACS